MNLPLYKAQITDASTGMYTVSLVDYPAVESDFLYFNENKKQMTFSIENEEQRIITGVLMRCDFPIYRITDAGYEYYIMYDKATIELMAEKWIADGFANYVNLQHNPLNYVDGVYLKELYIKDTERGINPKGFETISDGSLFATYKVLNDDVWNGIKSGEFKGFSLEGYFDVKEVQTPEEEAENALLDEIINMLNNILDKNK